RTGRRNASGRYESLTSRAKITSTPRMPLWRSLCRDRFDEPSSPPPNNFYGVSGLPPAVKSRLPSAQSTSLPGSHGIVESSPDMLVLGAMAPKGPPAISQDALNPDLAKGVIWSNGFNDPPSSDRRVLLPNCADANSCCRPAIKMPAYLAVDTAAHGGVAPAL